MNKYFHTCSFTERGASLTWQQIFLYGTTSFFFLFLLPNLCLFISCFSPPFQPTFYVFFPSCLSSHKSSTLICLLQTCSLSVSLTLYPACLFTFDLNLIFFSFSPVLLPYLLFLAPVLSHSSQTFHPVGPYLLLHLTLRPCCPTITSPSLSGCCPHCNCDRRAGSLSVIAHWSNTCQSEDPMWGSHCVFEIYVCLWAFVKDFKEENKFVIHSQACALLVVACVWACVVWCVYVLPPRLRVFLSVCCMLCWPDTQPDTWIRVRSRLLVFYSKNPRRRSLLI